MGTASVRYIVDDVEAAVDFYTQQLRFEMVMHPGRGFAMLERDNLRLLLNLPGAGGAGRAGGAPRPGGWNRFQITDRDLDATVERLRSHGDCLRSEIVEGRGGRQALIADPSGNLVELFEPKAG